MGALTANRKRVDECFNFNHQHPYLNSPEIRISKKPRFSYMNQGVDQVAVVSSKSITSRLSRYPEVTPLQHRKVHAPCRLLKFGAGRWNRDLNSRIRGFWEKEESSDMGNKLSLYYEKAKRSALGTIRYLKKDKEVIELDDEPGDDVKSEDSSVQEVQVVEDGREGLKQLLHEDNGFFTNVQELDGKIVEQGVGPSSSSAVSELTNGNLKAGNARRMMDILSLNEEVVLLDVSVYRSLLESAERRDTKLRSLEFQIELNEKRRSSFPPLKPMKKEPQEDIPREPFVALTEEDEAEVALAFSSNRRKVLVHHEKSSIDITGDMLLCLRPGAWLNDEVINLYLELLKERERREPQKFLKCHFFNTFFYKKLISGRSGYDYKSVRRWTTQKKLGYSINECEKIFVPIHKEIHWCLAVINKKDKKFQYLDSLKGMDSKVLKVLAQYFVDEVKDKNGQDIDLSSWEQEYVDDLPEQENGYDCGMFMIKYADFYSRGLGLCFNQSHMPYFRLRTAKEILKLRAD